MTVRKLLEEEKICDFAAIPLSACKVTKERLIADFGDVNGLYAVVLILPYPTCNGPSRFAAFSLIPDYHAYFTDILFKKLSAHGAFDNKYMKVFADHSPIDERHAAAAASLGVIGDNGLFISKKSGSFVFIGDVICSLSKEELEKEEIPVRDAVDIEGCLHCGKCAENCPAGCIGKDKSLCVSNLTQKKGVLSDFESDIIRKSGYVWGCDKCADVCPMNSTVQSREINPYFLKNRITVESYSVIEKMDDAEYAKWPFSWRKKDILRRNFDLYEKSKGDSK